MESWGKEFKREVYEDFLIDMDEDFVWGREIEKN